MNIVKKSWYRFLKYKKLGDLPILVSDASKIKEKIN